MAVGDRILGLLKQSLLRFEKTPRPHKPPPAINGEGARNSDASSNESESVRGEFVLLPKTVVHACPAGVTPKIRANFHITPLSISRYSPPYRRYIGRSIDRPLEKRLTNTRSTSWEAAGTDSRGSA